jgi:hypothetical protein
MAKGNPERSLQDVLRARRGVSSLLSPEQLRQREAARRREEEEQRRRDDEAAAARLAGRWHERGGRIDPEGRLSPSLYRAVFTAAPDAYLASAHWSRRAKAQLAHAATCERCGAAEELGVVHLHHDSIGEERPGRDLVTLCDGCRRRARRRSRELGRPLTRDELRALDPGAPLFDADAIAELRARYDLG